MVPRALYLLIPFLIALAAPGFGAVVRGTVRVPASESTPTARLNPYPGRANSLRTDPMNRGSVVDVVIYVDGPAPSAVPPGTAPERARRGGKLAQKNQAFQPRVLPVAAGARVDFPNMDPIYHNVFSVSPVKRFDLGKYGRGKSKSVVFTKPGLVKVYCDIHSNMEGLILVLPHAWFAQPEADGSFVLPILPAGTHRIKAWHPDLGERVVTITLEADEERAVEIAY